MNPGRTTELSEILLHWYTSNRRSFPWRDSRDPYHILVAEKLLQQTAVGRTVVECYSEIIGRYSTIGSLANADLEAIRGTIARLGLAYRADELIRMARFILDHFSGVVPANLDELRSIPGVGDYAARAVLAFSYGQDVAVVDTNVARILYRYFGLPGGLPRNPARSVKYLETAEKLVPAGNARDFNFAVLDFCAAICTSRNPKCGECPLRTQCQYSLGYRSQ